jgi:hypothetical protein
MILGESACSRHRSDSRREFLRSASLSAMVIACQKAPRLLTRSNDHWIEKAIVGRHFDWGRRISRDKEPQGAQQAAEKLEIWGEMS